VNFLKKQLPDEYPGQPAGIGAPGRIGDFPAFKRILPSDLCFFRMCVKFFPQNKFFMVFRLAKTDSGSIVCHLKETERS